MQSPTRLFFYWSLSGNPYQVLGHAFKESKQSYTLALRLIELDTDIE
jgi:hypothetical protein